MDFHQEQQARINKARAEIGTLAYERQHLSRQTDNIRERIRIIDQIVGEKEAVIFATEQAMRDFTSYLAVKEGAMTLDQIGEAINNGGNTE